MMFRESRNDRVAASAILLLPIGSRIGDNSAEIGVDAAGIVDIAAKVTPS